MEFSLIIPAKNEEKRILLPLLEYYHALYRKFGANQFEIIVVINNTTDETEGVVKLIKSVVYQPKSIVIKRIGKIEGKGRAIKYGFSIAKGNVLAFTDADGSVSPDSIINLSNQFEKNENKNNAVFGSRKMNGSIIAKKQNIIRQIFSYLFNFIIKTAFRIKSKDTQCPAKLFNKYTWQEIEESIISYGWTFDLNLYLLLKDRCIETPVTWEDANDSNLRIIPAFISVSKELLTLYARITKQRVFNYINAK